MREAEIFEPMLKNAAKKRKMDLNIAPLYVSRESTWFASLKEWNNEECENLLGKTRISVQDVFTLISTDVPAFVKEDHIHLKVKELPLTVYSKIIKHLLLDESKHKINKKIKSSRKLLIEYLRSVMSFENESSFVIIDLGFQGSINENIERALKFSKSKIEIIHILLMGANSIISKKMKNLDFRCFLSSPNLNQDFRKVIHRSLYPLEQSIIGRHASTKGYSFVNNKVSPVFKNLVIKEEDLQIKKQIHESIIIFQNLWYSIDENKRNFLKKDLFFPLGIRNLIGILHRLIEIPTYSEAILLGDLDHDHNNGAGEVMRICSSQDMKYLECCNSKAEFLKKVESMVFIGLKE